MHLIVLLHEPHSIYSTSHLTILLIKVNARPKRQSHTLNTGTMDTIPPFLRTFRRLDSRCRQGQALWSEGLCSQLQRRCPRSTSCRTAKHPHRKEFSVWSVSFRHHE